MAFCTQCGVRNEPLSRFCQACGTALPATNIGMSPGTVSPPPAVVKKQRDNTLKIVGIAVTVLVGLFVLFAIFLGAMIEFAKNDGKGTPKTLANSNSKAAVVPALTSAEDRAREGRLMCAEVQQQLTVFLKNSVKGIECQLTGETNGMIGLVVGYPAPALAKDGMLRRNTLLVTFSIVGSAMSKHSNVPVNDVYVIDSSRTSFKVSGTFARQLYTKMVNSQLSEKDGREEVAKFAQRVKIPKNGH